MSKTAVIFPGQGSQFVGMGQGFLETDAKARKLMALAEDISGMPLAKLCLEGPMEDLTRTVHLQPAMTVLNMMTWNALQEAGLKPDFYACHSLGEYAALYGSGVLSAEDTLKLVTERGRLMEREATKNPGAMTAILKLSIEDVQKAVQVGRESGEVTVANYNTEMQIVISGEKGAVEAAGLAAAEMGGRAIGLPVSGAWHSNLVAGAIPDFEKVMADTTFNTPTGTMLFNVTARSENDPAVIKTIMAQQIASMVRWYEIIMSLHGQGVTTFIEVGPKKVLTGMMKKLLPPDHGCTCVQVEDPQGIPQCLT